MFFINNAFAENVENQVQAGNFQNFTASLVPLLIFIAVFFDVKAILFIGSNSDLIR